jgi:hypothetical protein
MKKNLSLLKKLGILSVLCFCLGFITVANDVSAAPARPCCSYCAINPVDPDPNVTPDSYCTDQCGSSSGTCYTNCINQIYSCWRWCQFDC